MKSQSVAIEMEAIEQYFQCGTVYYAVQGGSNSNLSLWMKF